MAKPPQSLESLIEQYGPHLKYEPSGGGQQPSPEKLVKTHCCFCGQQCDIQLTVRNNEVVGFEPWEEFPFNRGRLCPKGVKRYLQSGHPDRLLNPLIREDQRFRAASWDEALDFTARRLRETQDRDFQQPHVQRQLKETETKLEQKHFNPEEEIDVLQSMIQAKRRQQPGMPRMIDWTSVSASSSPSAI